ILILFQQKIPDQISTKTWLLVIALGFTFGLGNLGILAAFARHGKASIITPLSGLYPLVSIPIAILALGERIGWREAMGMALALGAVAALSWETPPAVSAISSRKSEILSPNPTSARESRVPPPP